MMYMINAVCVFLTQLERINLSAAQTLRAAFIKVGLIYTWTFTATVFSKNIFFFSLSPVAQKDVFTTHSR